MNKLIAVTGGSKGIGKAILERFAREGFDIVTCARNTTDLKQLKEELEGKFPIKAHVITADLSVKEQALAFADFVNNLHRPVQVLVNNAGYFVAGNIAEEPDGILESMINNNLYSAYYVTRGIIKSMKERREGHIINMCSIASIIAYPNGGSYSISKFAMLGFSKVLREELKPFNIRVTSVLPGATLTGSWEGANIPRERFIPVEDIASTVYATYALSDRSVVEEILIRPQLGDI